MKLWYEQGKIYFHSYNNGVDCLHVVSGPNDWIAATFEYSDGYFHLTSGRLDKKYQSMNRAKKWLFEHCPQWGNGNNCTEIEILDSTVPTRFIWGLYHEELANIDQLSQNTVLN